jgi:hypothetical protein
MSSNQDQVTRYWILIIYRVPQDPPGRRTYVWRYMKRLGAVYLQQAVAILPDLPKLRTTLEALATRIREFPGEVSLLQTTSPSPEWEQDLIRQFNQARDAEYEELMENIERFEDEVRRESQKGKFTFAELEDIESDWEKVQRWHERITGRDFFEAPGRCAAGDALTRGQKALEAFSAAVYEHEGVQGDSQQSTAQDE